MKNNSGITLTSLIIYIIGMVIVISIVSTLTIFFYKNIDITEMNGTTSQYTKFSSIFSNEINTENNPVIDCKTFTENGNKVSYIIFLSGNQYTFNGTNKTIYKNNIKICNNIEDCDFSYSYVDSKYMIKVNFRTNTINMSGDNAITYYN